MPDGKVWFKGSDPADSRRAIYVTDGTVAGTKMIVKGWSGTKDSPYFYLTTSPDGLKIMVYISNPLSEFGGAGWFIYD